MSEAVLYIACYGAFWFLVGAAWACWFGNKYLLPSAPPSDGANDDNGKAG